MISKIKKLSFAAAASVMFGFALSVTTLSVDHEGEIAYVLAAIACEAAHKTTPLIAVEPPTTTVNCSNCWCTAKTTERTSCLNLTSVPCTAAYQSLHLLLGMPTVATKFYEGGY